MPYSRCGQIIIRWWLQTVKYSPASMTSGSVVQQACRVEDSSKSMQTSGCLQYVGVIIFCLVLPMVLGQTSNKCNTLSKIKYDGTCEICASTFLTMGGHDSCPGGLVCESGDLKVNTKVLLPLNVFCYLS